MMKIDPALVKVKWNPKIEENKVGRNFTFETFTLKLQIIEFDFWQILLSNLINEVTQNLSLVQANLFTRRSSVLCFEVLFALYKIFLIELKLHFEVIQIHL